MSLNRFQKKIRIFILLVRKAKFFAQKNYNLKKKIWFKKINIKWIDSRKKKHGVIEKIKWIEKINKTVELVISKNNWNVFRCSNMFWKQTENSKKKRKQKKTHRIRECIVVMSAPFSCSWLSWIHEKRWPSTTGLSLHITRNGHSANKVAFFAPTYVDKFRVVTLLQVVKNRSIVKVCQVWHIFCLLIFWWIDLCD